MSVRYLLDTHALAWAVGAPHLLGQEASRVLRDPNVRPVVSPASVWEMSIKHHLGKWPEVAPFMDEQLYRQFLRQLGAEELPISSRHARLAGQWSAPHRDPFDRLIAAQAILEGLPVLSKDGALDAFAVQRTW